MIRSIRVVDPREASWEQQIPGFRLALWNADRSSATHVDFEADDITAAQQWITDAGTSMMKDTKSWELYVRVQSESDLGLILIQTALAE
jgi:hypothetical protein